MSQNDITDLLEKASDGFGSLNVDDKYKKSALENIRLWLTEKMYEEYVPQMVHIINNGYWDYLLDCFYQIIPFGTGGRRGEVGIGPNRINKWRIQASAQGHSQYLKKQYKEEAEKRGVVITYGVREFFGNKYLNNDILNPVKNLKGVDLANSAAQVYSANNIRVFMFDSPRTTPELSFCIRHLKAVAGAMLDASHNPPEHNGKKVYDEYGGQLIPPYDENLVNEVTKNVKKILILDKDEALKNNLITMIGEEVDNEYLKNIENLSLSDKRNIKIAFTPLHGVGETSVYKCLKKMEFDVSPDPKTSNQSGKFENVTFNIPNPEVEESFETTKVFANEINADIILNSDPDADRIGIMVKHQGNWRFLNGNEIGAILVNYVISKKKNSLKGKGVVIKTDVTTNIATEICNKNDTEMIGNLLVGFKYIGAVMNDLENEGKIDNFLIGLEESHGYIAGNYLRDKDAAIAGLWLAELASELKDENKTIVDYLNDIYAKYGYFRNYLTEIRLPGAEGMSQINKIQDEMRKIKPKSFGIFETASFEDCLDRKPIVSETDRMSKNVIIFHFKPVNDINSAKITLRPSGTEPKIKMYFELGTKPFNPDRLEGIKMETEKILKDLEKQFMIECYKIIGIDFPERGFLLFWQLPLNTKLHYFEIEEDILKLKDEQNEEKRKEKLFEMLSFLGSDPLEKINKAFEKKYEKPILEYLSLTK